MKPIEYTPPPQEASTPAASAAISKQVVTSSDSKPPENDPPETPDIEAYNVKKPALMGIRLVDTKTTVAQKFSDPLKEFVMEDEQDPLTVFEYEGFIVGFNNAGLVEFIEITSDEVNPGLGGLRLGQKVKDAEKALGKPDTNTNYALQYKAGGTILKLDIDRKTESIISIKLFADSK